MSSDEAVKKKIRNIQPREWGQMLSHILIHPDVASTSGIAPEAELDELPEIVELLNLATKEKPIVKQETSQILVKNFIKEGLFQIQKANYNLKLAFLGLEQSYGAPSLSNFYQSAYTCADGILKLHGIHKANKKGSKNQWIVDLYSSIGKKKVSPPPTELMVINLDGVAINHKEFWMLFNKVILSTVYQGKELNDFKGELRKAEPENFMTQRNYVNYRATFWPFDEFHNNNSVKIIFEQVKGKECISFENLDFVAENFLPNFSKHIILFGNNLFSEISKASNAFQAEEDLLKKNLYEAFKVLDN